MGGWVQCEMCESPGRRFEQLLRVMSSELHVYGLQAGGTGGAGVLLAGAR